MNLVLIGYRGAGKTAVAERLAERLGMVLVSLDEEIVRQEGCSIPEIVAKHGWPRFRDIETEVTERFSERDGIIIDCGGGVILREENVVNLRRSGKLFWLRASVPVIVQRIQGGTERPALKEGKSFTDEVEEVLLERTPLYAAAADYVIETDAASLDDLAAEIARLFGP